MHVTELHLVRQELFRTAGYNQPPTIAVAHRHIKFEASARENRHNGQPSAILFSMANSMNQAQSDRLHSSPLLRAAAIVAAIGLLSIGQRAFAVDLPNPPTPGTYTLTIQSGGFDRTSHVHIPTGYKSGTKPPLVILLHGAGGSGLGMLDRDGWRAKSDTEGFIAVAPDGLPTKPHDDPKFLQNPNVWNAGQLRPGSQRTKIDDVAFIAALLDALQSKVPYDANRVFCAGHSNGATMTMRLGAELSDRLTAIGTVAGLLSVPAHPKRPLPTLCIYGTKDPLVPIDGGPVKLPWGTRTNPPVATPLAALATAIGCSTDPQTVSDSDGLKKVVYRSNSGGPTLTVIYIDGQGHNWPRSKSALPESMVGPSTKHLDATAAIWEFFKKAK